MMIVQVTAASLPNAPGRLLGIVALISWVLTASIGAYMLRTWIVRGGLRRQRATGVGVPPAVVFGHAGAAVSGLGVWIGYVTSGWRPLTWLGVVLVGTAISLGICTVTLWTPYPIRYESAPASEAMFGTAGRPPGTTEEGAEEQSDMFTVTDEMIAKLLTEPPPPPRRRKTSLVPLIPVVHGFAAITTFMLVVIAAALAV
jgi:hypothetical protein